MQQQLRHTLRQPTPDSDGTPREYGGDPSLIHVSDGQRARAGIFLARHLDQQMRRHAVGRTEVERAEQALCPGCYMVVGFNMMTELARANGQSLRELGLSMALAFSKLAAGGEDAIEHIVVCLDPEDAA